MIRIVVSALLAVALLGGCAMFGDDDNSEPPAKLESFEQKVRLRSVWSRDTGDGTDEQLVRLVPTVVGDRVYVADRNGSVRAYQLENGKELWRAKTRVAVSAGPGVGDGVVLVGSSEAELVALDADTGEERWRTLVSSEVLSVPQVYSGVVIVQSVDGNIAGLDLDSGDRLWLHDGSVPVLTLRGTSTPLVGEGFVLAGFASGKMIALEVETGREVWDNVIAVPQGRSELQRIVDIDADPLVSEGVLYVTSYQGRLAAIGLENGRLLWDRDMSSYAGLAVDRQQIFVSDADSEVWALDRSSGASLWKQNAFRRRSLTAPAVVDEYVAAGDFEGYLHLISRFDGSLAGRQRVDSKGIQAKPIVLGDRILVLGSGGKLVLYQVETL
ncbi:outer membrane protein assembly factor BamB [Thiogranum longum]